MSTVYTGGNYQAVTFFSPIDASASANAPTLEIYGNATFNHLVGSTRALGALTVNGDTNLASNVTTSGTQRYNNPYGSWSGSTIISTPVTLTTTNSNYNWCPTAMMKSHGGSSSIWR